MEEIKKLLVVCGPTAVGKTSLGILLAKKFNGEIISADSRQVYKGMDIGTGKEYSDKIKIWGYDISSPEAGYSAGRFIKFAREKIKGIWNRGKLPILVGGTGLYIRGVIDGIATAGIHPNQNLRSRLQGVTLQELQDKLEKVDRKKFKLMNDSDKKNPRRLIRAIEVAIHKSQIPSFKFETNLKSKIDKLLIIGLTADLGTLFKRIEGNIEKRIKAGIKREIDLLKKKKMWTPVVQTTLGYREWPDITRWKLEEKRYAKRQMVWFKRDKRIKWFDIEDKAYPENVENLVQKWYSSS